MDVSPLYRAGSAVIGADSKTLQWTREREELRTDLAQFKIPISAVLEPADHAGFEDAYDEILKTTCRKFDITPKRKVYKAHTIGALIGGSNAAKYRAFCYEFQRRLLDLADLEIHLVMTLLNHKYLKADGLVHIGGRYGHPTRKLSTGEFVNRIQSSHHLLASWYHLREKYQRGATVLLDGTDSIYPCKAWQDLISRQHLRIVTRGDEVLPILSAADILLRAIDFSREERRVKIFPDTITRIMGLTDYAAKVRVSNMAHDVLNLIRPETDTAIFEKELGSHMHRPIIFVAGSDVEGARDHLEQSPLYDSIMERATALRASVRIYQRKRDRFLLGTGEVPDFFVPIVDKDWETLRYLRGVGKKVEELAIDRPQM